MWKAALLLSFLLSHWSAQPSRDRTFWISIVEQKYEVPQGEDPYKLLVEMNALLASPDPVLRDDVAYSSAERWIVRKRLLSPEQQKALLTDWLRNLTAGIGEREGDSVFRRSFSALNLSLLAAIDNERPFLDHAEYEDFLSRILSYLELEKDTRGYDAARGWIHTAAHTADVLKFLARNPKLQPPSQAKLLAAVSAKCEAFGRTFAWGEDERLAQVIRSLVRRADFDPAAFESWLKQFPQKHRQLWAKGPAIDPAAYPGVANGKLLLRAAFVALSADTDLQPNAQQARELMLKTLGSMR